MLITYACNWYNCIYLVHPSSKLPPILGLSGLISTPSDNLLKDDVSLYIIEWEKNYDWRQNFFISLIFAVVKNSWIYFQLKQCHNVITIIETIAISNTNFLENFDYCFTYTWQAILYTWQRGNNNNGTRHEPLSITLFL